MSFILINSFFIQPPPVTPADFSPLAWFKADDYSQVDGTVLASDWVDHGSEAANGVVVGGKQPTFRTNIFGSLPAVRFLANQYLSRTVKTYGFPGDSTIAWVTKSLAVNCLATSYTGNANIFYGFNSGGSNVNIYRVSAGSFFQSSVIAETAASARLNWVTTSSAANIAVRVNKNSYGNGGVSGIGLTVDRIGSDTVFAGMDTGEICIFNGIMSGANMDALYDQYFKPKWGLP